MKEIIITDKEANQRLDKFLLKYFNKAPKSLVYKLLRKKRIKYNGAKAAGNEILQMDGVVSLFLSDDTLSGLTEADKLNADAGRTFIKLYEDRNVLVVNKPAGTLSQKDKDAGSSLIEQVLLYLWEQGEYDPDTDTTFTPALCNRLDRNTSGIVIIGKSVAALQAVGKALERGDIEKRYTALVKGVVKRGGKFRAFLFKDAKTNEATVSETQKPYSKPITTLFEPVRTSEKYSLLDVTIKTGRPHQIRAHLTYLGFPVVGDKKYGHKGTNMTFLRKFELNRQFLHAHKIVFNGMEGDFSYLNGKEIICPLPYDLKEIAEEVFGANYIGKK